MAQRLVWNFEVSATSAFSLAQLHEEQQDTLKWEARFFWPEEDIITLYAIDDSLHNLAFYKQKHREDEYYLLPTLHYNIKRRRNELLYKPIVSQSNFATGFGSKIRLDEDNTALLDEMRGQIAHAQVVPVVKDAFIYPFKTVPTVKLELARLEVANKVYFSACVEGRSAFLVEQISKHLLGGRISCDYVSFLKDILKSC